MKSLVRGSVSVLLAGLGLIIGAPAIAQELYATDGSGGDVFGFTIPGGTESTFATGLGASSGIAFDTFGNAYVEDVPGGFIFKIPYGGGAATIYASGLTIASGIAIDNENNLYVVDGSTRYCYKYTAPNVRQILDYWHFSNASGIAVDSQYNVFVADGSSTIMRCPPNGSFYAFSRYGQLPVNDTEGLVCDSSGDLFISSKGMNTIYKMYPAGQYLYTFVSGLNSPTGLTMDDSGNLYEAEPDPAHSGQFHILKFAPNTAKSTFASGLTGLSQIAVQSCNDGPPNPLQNLFLAGNQSGKFYEFGSSGAQTTFASGLSQPFGLTFDSAGNAFVGDVGNGNVYKFTPGGVKTTFASGLQPTNIVADSAGDVFVADTLGGNILEFDPVGIQRPDFATGLNQPTGMTFDNGGNLYVGDANGNINEFPPSGGSFVYASGLPVNDSFSMAFDSLGNLFVLDETGGNIFEIPPGGGSPTAFASGLSAPVGLTCDADNDVLVAVADGSQRIFKYTPDGSQYTFASGISGLGQLAFQPPLPYGNGTFLSFDPISPYPAIAFNSGLAYYTTNDALYAVSGPDSSGTIYSGDDFAYSIPSTLSSTVTYQDLIENPGALDIDGNAPTPTVAKDGTTYIMTASGILYALDPQGNLKWTYSGAEQDGVGGSSTVSIGLDGNIYVTSDDGPVTAGVLYCIDPQLGLPKWKLALNNGAGLPAIIDSPLVCTYPGTYGVIGIYGADEFGYLHSITYYGQEYINPLHIGPQYPGDFPNSSPAAGTDSSGATDNFLRIGTGDGKLLILNGGSLYATIPLDGTPVSASPVVGPDGTTYVGTTGGNMFAVSPVNRFTHVIAEANLGSVIPTTAAVGSDSRVYVATSTLNGQTLGAPGSLLSMHLQPVCNQTLPERFVIDSRVQVSDGGFVGAPLIAQVSATHNSNVVYAANTDGNIYGYLATAGPSTGTWSTFRGNDQRQGTWDIGRKILPPDLWSIQFGPSGSQLNQTGKAAFGNSATDYWYPGSVPNNSNPSFSVNAYTNGTPTITITPSDNTVVYNAANVSQDPFNDNMMGHFMYSTTSFTLNINNLPTLPLRNGQNGGNALFDIYVYAYGGSAGSQSLNSTITMNPPGTDPVTGSQVSTLTTTETTPPDLTHFVEGQEYVVFRNVPVSSANPTVQITVAADPNNSESVPLINGIQFVARQ